MASSATTPASESTNAPAATTTASGVPYVGSRISLISKSRIRYVGTLYTIDTKASTVALKDVKSYGTEDRVREGGPIAPSEQIYAYIIFRGPDILDLQFLTTNSEAGEKKEHNGNEQDAESNLRDGSVKEDENESEQQGENGDDNDDETKEKIVQNENWKVNNENKNNNKESLGLLQGQSNSNMSTIDHGHHSFKPMTVRGPTPRAWGPPPGIPSENILNQSSSTTTTTTMTNNNMNNTHYQTSHNFVATTTNATSSGTETATNVRYNSHSYSNGGPMRTRGRTKSHRGWRRGPGIKIPDEDFDFERMNEQFEKAGLNQNDEQLPAVEMRYDKSKSFFDDLLPEKEMRSERNAAQQRATDFETFGETRAYRHRNYRGSRGRRGGRGRSRGRGGYNNAENGSSYFHHSRNSSRARRNTWSGDR